MKKYVKGSLTSGLVGIWWIYDDKVLGDAVPLDAGYDDGRYIHYDDFKNHSTEWRRVLQDQLTDKFNELYPKGFKCIERGRVVYNIRTQSYEILCSDAVAKNSNIIKLIVDAYDLNNCRYDVYPDHHYYVFELTGNPVIDNMEYGIQ